MVVSARWFHCRPLSGQSGQSLAFALRDRCTQLLCSPSQPDSMPRSHHWLLFTSVSLLLLVVSAGDVIAMGEKLASLSRRRTDATGMVFSNGQGAVTVTSVNVTVQVHELVAHVVMIP